ncbi:MAG: glycosyltransferase family 39 protein [Pseudonocardia sp.]|nr:glycosyltransferase family 39 protein [Pseudonocardia sp.]
MTATLNASEPDPAAPTPVPVAAAPRRPRWEFPALAALLLGTAVLYLWNLSASGFGNTFYAAAVQSGTQNWTAFFFGSLDSANAITVDKPPASLWVMALSGRIFGFSSWSMLAPQALMAVGAVALLWATVRRVAGPGAGLLAGAVLALTPVAVMMFRFNNPDALLVLLMVAAAWATTHAVEKASTRWLLLAGVFLGFGFLTKMLQAFLVVPGLAAAYLWAAPTTVWRRIRQLLAAGVAIVVSAGWWLLAVALWPVDARPYIGGSTNNSPLELAFGYNGLGRIFGGEGNGGMRRGAEMAGGFPRGAGAAAGGMPPGGMPPGGMPPGGMPGGMGGFGGQAGLTRLFNTEIGGQISWLLPAALILLVAGLWFTRRAPREDRVRAALLLWGGWTLVSALVFALMEGTFHAYYTVALAPGIAALVAVGGREAWQARETWTGRGVLAGTTAVTAVWAWVLLGRSTTFLPWLRWVVLAAGVVAVAGLLVPAGWRARVATVVAGAALVAGLAGPTAYAVQTAVTPHQGGIPTAGPSTGVGTGPGGRMRGRVDGAQRDGATARGAAGQQNGVPGGPGGFGMGGPGGEQVDARLAGMLTSAGTRWAAATMGSQGAANLELRTGTAVMAIGGFIGSDPSPTLAQFQADVANGDIHYFIAGGMDGGRGRGNSEISQWVQQHFTAQTVGNQTVYDLTQPVS